MLLRIKYGIMDSCWFMWSEINLQGVDNLQSATVISDCLILIEYDVQVNVTGAGTEVEAATVARSVASSSLTKAW